MLEDELQIRKEGEIELPVDGRVELFVSSDGMTAELSVTGPLRGGKPVTLPQSLQVLQYSGVIHGIDEAAVENALLPENDGKKLVVARGRPAVPGTDCQIQYRFPLPGTPLRPVEMPDGRVDYHNLNLIHNVKKSDVLAVRIPPVPGQPGMTVTGKPVPPKPVKDAQLPRGRNTAFDESGNLLLAEADGHVEMTDGRVTVQILLEVRSDVSFATGNINCLGSVLIRGDIRSGFEVHAGGNVEVHGLIEAAVVTAGGNLLAKAGIAGGGKALIKAGKDIVARFIENALVEAGGNVLINDSILNTNIKAGHSVKVEGKRGTLCGGIIQAGEEVLARVLGSPQCLPTVVEVGVNPRLRQDYLQLSKGLRERKLQLEGMEQAAGNARKLLETHHDLVPARKTFLLDQIKAFATTREEVELLDKKCVELEEEINRLTKGRVRVMETVHPAVKITVARASVEIEQPQRFVQFVLDKNVLKAIPFR